MENENRESQDDAEVTEDLEVSEDEAEGVAGGKKRSDPDAGAQRA